jgi:hypothetical protein
MTLLLCLIFAAAGVQAQSGYRLSALSKTRADAAIQPLALDQQDQVLGNADFFYKNIRSSSGLFWFFKDVSTPIFQSFGVRWPTTTLASIKPVKLGQAADVLTYAASPNGSKRLHGERLAALGGRLWIQDAASGLISDVPLQEFGEVTHRQRLNRDFRGSPINDQGWLLGYEAPSADNAYLIDYNLRYPILLKGALPWQALPMPNGYPYGDATHINNQGTIVGVGYGSAKSESIAIMWVNGAADLLPQKEGWNASPQALSSAGHVLIQHSRPTDLPIANGQLRWMSSVFFNGSAVDITPGQEAQNVLGRSVNAKGVVVGQYSTVQTDPNKMIASESAFIWSNGTFSNLTAWMAAKGLKLPTGQRFSDAISVNDRGSILARVSNGQTPVGYVRLQAIP